MATSRIDAVHERVLLEPDASASFAHDAGLFDLLGIVRRRKWLLAWGLLVGLGLAVLYFFQATPIYESEVQILVMRKDSSLPTKGVESSGYDYQADQDLLATHVQLFQSSRIVKQAIERHKLAQLSTFREQAEKSETFDPVLYIQKNLEVGKGGKGQAKDARVLKATFSGPSPEDCAAVLVALAESYQDFLGETFKGTSSEAVELITRAKGELLEQLTTAESDYQKFREGAPLLWEGDKSANPHQEAMKQLEQSLREIQLRRTSTQARLAVIEEVLEKSKNEAEQLTALDKLALIGSEDVARLQLMLDAARGDAASEAFLSAQPLRTEVAQTEFQKLLTLVLEERKMVADYGPDHPDVKRIRDQIEAAKKYVESRAVPAVEQTEKFNPADLLKAHVGLLRHDLLELDRREKALLALADKEQKAAKSLVDHEIRNEMLRADITRKRTLYDTIVARLHEINLVKDYGGFITEIIVAVEVPVKPVSPKLLLVIGLGGILGIFGSAGLAYVVELADRTFRSPHEVQQALELPLWGDVPAFPAKKMRQTQTQKVSANGKAGSNGNGKPAPQADIAPALVAYHRPSSREAEAIRGLRTALSFGTKAGGQKIIQITSPNAKDGKSTTIANLAVSLAQSGKRVLLVDADLRRPTIHKVFGIDAQVGLTDVINGESELPDAVQSVGIQNLSVLPCGPCPANPSELLASAAFEQLLAVLREQYDYVLVDSPPMLAVSDPAVIAPRVDGVLLAIRITKNGAPSAVRARQMLAGLGASVLGCVVNGFGQDPHYGYGSYGGKYGYAYGKYGYGYGYGYYGYGYGSDAQEKTRNGQYYKEDLEEATA